MTLYLLEDIENFCFEKITSQNVKNSCTKINGQNCRHDLVLRCFKYSFQISQLKKV